MLELGIIIAILVGIAEVAKQIGLANKYVPIMNLLLGLIAGVVVMDAPTFQEQVIMGLIAGLSASGLYDQSKIAKK